jgi:hypothetical protein
VTNAEAGSGAEPDAGGGRSRALRALGRVQAWAPDLAPDDRYVPLADLDLAELAAAVCLRLGGAPMRVGWSAALMGVASRLWSVTVVPFVSDGVLIDPACLLIRHDEGAVVLGLREPRGRTSVDLENLDRAVRSVLEPMIARIPLADRLLWGNVAASLHAVPRVHALPAARDVVDALLTGPQLEGELVPAEDGRARRRTCCLFYLVPGAGLCGDCVFEVAPAHTLRRSLASLDPPATGTRWESGTDAQR